MVSSVAFNNSPPCRDELFQNKTGFSESLVMSPTDNLDKEHAPNSCGPCRRQRVRCDRRLPICQRCSTMRRACQYSRPKTLRWANSLAIRGKLMGKTTFGPENAFPKKDPESRMPRYNYSSINLSNGSLGTEASISKSLVEPGLQDLSPECRNYIRYFDLELSNECVVYNVRSTNPFLALMPLIPTSQALTHIMVSISAFHLSHRRMVHSANMNPPELRGLTRSSSGYYQEQSRQTDFNGPLLTALLHKEKALKCLARELQNDTRRSNDGLTAAVILSICIDVVESGEMGWMHHIHGAKELIKRRKNLLTEGDLESRTWLQYFETACTTFDIMGSTLSKSKTTTGSSDVLQKSLLETLQKSEEKTWVGCPAELLYILAAIHSLLSFSVPQNQLSEMINIQFDLENFSALEWALKSPSAEHCQPRFHLASAYKAAVEIYTSHVLGPLPGNYYLSNYYISNTIQSAIAHMESIPANDFHIKSLVWPAFIIGAETEMKEQKTSVQVIFHNIWVASCCRNAKNAGEMLERIWNRPPEERVQKSWLQYMYEQDNWLFV